ncbi:unnamed protein product [Symbiodinium sp. CCMP2592]|nr:unnamed protein product [Symbiodinium sp. CCMP2592]
MRRALKRSGLEDGATTLMMRRLPEDWDAQRILEWLRDNKIQLSQIDFLYVPFDKRTDCNIELAFINFLDHSSAKKAYSLVVRQNRDHVFDAVVNTGNIQGLAWNLAYFLARFGFRAIWDKDAPLVFRNGIQLQGEEISKVYASLPDDIVEEAARFVRAELGTSPHGSRRRAQQLTWKLGEDSEVSLSPTFAMGTNVVQMGLDGSEEELLALLQDARAEQAFREETFPEEAAEHAASIVCEPSPQNAPELVEVVS